MKAWHIELGDCREVLQSYKPNAFDAVVTDPPYGLEFMGKDWDHGVPGIPFWLEVLRVLKPGGHLLAFGGTRTYHRLACAIEDAGFEIRDSIDWIYGSGFPKSLDISKSYDRRRLDRGQVYQVTGWIAGARDAAGVSNADIDAAFDFNGMAGHWTSSTSQPSVPTLDQVPKLLEVLGSPEVPEDVAELLIVLNGRKGQPGEAWFRREVLGTKTGYKAHYGGSEPVSRDFDVTASATEHAKKWEGWGTALKPGHEPIVLARKPLEGTVASNVQKWGTGGINVDGCRLETVEALEGLPVGRWPPNIALSEEAAAELDEQSGELTSGDFTRSESAQSKAGAHGIYKQYKGTPDGSQWEANSGGASRYFPIFRYEPKASRTERDEGLDSLPERSPGDLMDRKDGAAGTNHARAGAGHGGGRNIHPTVKPVALMQWLCRLVTPPGGVVLDPFAGSGSTGVAALREGFEFTGIELDPEYHALACLRIEEDAPLFNRRLE